MHLHLLSDLHLEFGAWTPPAIDADVIVLAGDIHLGREGRRWARDCFANKPVVYVLGNHEFYRHATPELTETLKRETGGSNIHVLENDVIDLNGFTFLGCTLWTDFQLVYNPVAAMSAANDTMSDFHLIRVSQENRFLRAQDTVRMHTQSVLWLQSRLAECDLARTIVVTHHAPSARSIPPYHLGSPLNAAFASKLDKLVEASRVPLWIHGHTHYNVDYTIGATRVLSNQRGYPDEPADGFDPGLIVEV